MPKHTSAHIFTCNEDDIHRGIEQEFDKAMLELHCKYHVKADSQPKVPTDQDWNILDSFFGALANLLK